MNFNYPIYITNIYKYDYKCRNWRNVITPINILTSNNQTFKNIIAITYDYKNNQFIFRDNSLINYCCNKIDFKFVNSQSNNYVAVCLRDDNMNRLTNFVGYNVNQGWIKHCPCCGQNKPLINFDYSGRVTNEIRDQSNCNECRGKY